MATNRHKDRILEGERLFSRNRLHEALQTFDSIVQEDPENLAALNDKGVVLNGLGRFEEAVRVFSQIIEKNPARPDSVFNLISNCLSLSRWKDAEEHLAELSEHLRSEDFEILAREVFEKKFGSSSDKARLIHVPFSLTIDSRRHDLRLFLDIDQYSQKILWDHLRENRIYEGETLQFIAKALKTGDRFIDIGAHIGYFSLICSRIAGNEGAVISVEPHPLNHIHFSKHLSINSIQNVRLIRAVVGAGKGESDFYYNSDNDGGHAIWDPGLHPFNRRSRNKPIVRKVPMITLDDLIREAHGLVKIIKIDTEGAEMGVLKGGERSLQRFQVPFVICEINRFGLHQMGSSETELREFMNALGYETYLMQERSPGLVKLQREQSVESQYVFNLLFSKGSIPE